MANSQTQKASSLDNVKPLMEERGELTMAKKRIEDRIKELDETLRPVLSNRGPVVYGGYQFECKMTAGRRSLDAAALKDAGIDLEPYYKVGAPFTTMTVKVVNEI